MRASQIERALEMMVGTGKSQKITPLVIGKPGIGKSHIIKQVAEKLGYEVLDVRLSQIEASDLKGIPAVDVKKGTSKWYAPEFLPFVGNPRFENTKGFLFLDEINRAQPDVVQAVFELIYDYRTGDNKLLDSWYVVAAGNMGLEDGCDVNEFDTAMNDRLCYLPFDENIDEWIKWAEKHKIREEIIGFIKTNSKYFYYEVDKSKKINITPRRWAQFSNVLNDNCGENGMSVKEAVSLLGNSMIYGATPILLQYLTEIESINGADVLKKYSKIADKIKTYELSRLTQLSDNLVEVLKTKDSKKIGDTELQNLYDFMHNHLPSDLLLGFWCKVGKETPEIGQQFGAKFPEFDDHVTQIIIKSINASKTTSTKE